MENKDSLKNESIDTDQNRIKDKLVMSINKIMKKNAGRIPASVLTDFKVIKFALTDSIPTEESEELFIKNLYETILQKLKELRIAHEVYLSNSYEEWVKKLKEIFDEEDWAEQIKEKARKVILGENLLSIKEETVETVKAILDFIYVEADSLEIITDEGMRNCADILHEYSDFNLAVVLMEDNAVLAKKSEEGDLIAKVILNMRACVRNGEI